MSESSRDTPENIQVQKESPQNKAPDCEKEQLKSEIIKLRETISQNDSFRDRAINAEAKISSLQQSNENLIQQVNNLTLQNSQLLNEIASLKSQKNSRSPKSTSSNAQLISDSQEMTTRNQDFQLLQNTILKMEEKFQQELAFRDDLIKKMRAKINFNSSSQVDSRDEMQEKMQKISQQQKKMKNQLAKNKKETMQKFSVSDSDDSNNSSEYSNSKTDQKLLEQKYLKKKNELTLMKQQFNEFKDESQHQIKKAKEDLDEVKQKFHILKKKYVDLKEDFSSLQICYQAVVQKTESLSVELQRSNKHYNDNNADDLPKITIKMHDHKNKVIKTEEKNPQQKDKYKEMKRRAQKAEKDLAELRCFIQILANNEKNIDKLNNKNQNIINQLESLGVKIDRLEKNDDYQNNVIRQRKNVFNYQEQEFYQGKRTNDHQNVSSSQKKRKNDYQENIRMNDYQKSHSHQKNKTTNNQRHRSPPKQKITVYQEDYSTQTKFLSDYQDSFSSPRKRSKSVKKESRKLPQWRKFKDL